MLKSEKRNEREGSEWRVSERKKQGNGKGRKWTMEGRRWNKERRKMEMKKDAED